MTVIPSVQKLHTQMHFQINLLIEPISLALWLPFGFSFDLPLVNLVSGKFNAELDPLGGGVYQHMEPL